MANIKIQHHFKESIMGCFCQPLEGVSSDFRKELKPNEQITSAKAIKILRKIEYKSKAQAFLTKPVVAISLTLAATIGGYVLTALAASSMAMAILGITLSIGGTLALGIVVRSACNGSLHKMSEAYQDKANAAHKYIEEIKNAGNNAKIIVA